MLADILEAIRIKKESFVFLGKRMVCTELAISDNLGVSVKTDEDQQRLEDEFIYRLVVRCVTFDNGQFDGEINKLAGQPVFTDDDLPALMKGGKQALLPLFEVVRRVNGLDGDANAKK